MKQFKRFMLALAAMMLFVSPAFATAVDPQHDTTPVDTQHEAADYFTPVSLSELGDLGDESMPFTALALAAGASAAGAVFVHKLRAKT